MQLQLPNLLYKLLLFFLISRWWQNHLIDFQLLKPENWFHILLFLVFLPRVSAMKSKYNFHPPLPFFFFFLNICLYEDVVVYISTVQFSTL